MESYVLPNGLSIKQINPHETAHLYKEIFDKKVYLRHGVKLPDRPVVFDAGANIGLFTLFVLTNCPGAAVYAVEPAPKTFQALSANTAGYKQVKAYNCGVGGENGEKAFMYFPMLTCGSGYYQSADVERIRMLRRSIILADPEMSKSFAGPLGEELLDYRLDELLRGEVVTTEVHPLSFFIDENRINDIDLLKVDVEGSEKEVLRGIRDEHWEMIAQMVVEVHDKDASLAEVTEVLEKRGFSVEAEIERLPDNLPKNLGGKAVLYAVRAQGLRT
jgi:FkbM family methyltransferase